MTGTPAVAIQRCTSLVLYLATTTADNGRWCGQSRFRGRRKTLADRGADSLQLKVADSSSGTWAVDIWRRFLVREARALGLEVIDRCNLTVLLEPGQEDLVEFLAANQVRYADTPRRWYCTLRSTSR